MTRRTSTRRILSAGCQTCYGDKRHWTGSNAQALAARHHDSTGHPTWCDVFLEIRYGEAVTDARQIDIEDAIRGVSL